MQNDSYRFIVVFTRSLGDDANVLGKEMQACTDQDLIQQFRIELQEAYDETAMAGSFDIVSILR